MCLSAYIHELECLLQFIPCMRMYDAWYRLGQIYHTLCQFHNYAEIEVSGWEDILQDHVHIELSIFSSKLAKYFPVYQPTDEVSLSRFTDYSIVPLFSNYFIVYVKSVIVQFIRSWLSILFWLSIKQFLGKKF